MDNAELVRSLSTLQRSSKYFHFNLELNDKLIFEQKRQFYSKEIELTDRLNRFRAQLLDVHPLNCSFLQSAFLDDNPLFEEIKSLYTKYNSEILRLTLENKQPEELNLRPHVMKSMLLFMQHVISCTNR